MSDPMIKVTRLGKLNKGIEMQSHHLTLVHILFSLNVGIHLVTLEGSARTWRDLEAFSGGKYCGKTSLISPKDGRNHRIAGGHHALPGMFQSYVFIDSTDKLGDIISCGGIIISSDYVLTAGHCIPKKAKTIEISTGNTKKTISKPQILYADHVCRLKGYVLSNPLNLDIALLRLSKKIEFDESVSPACISFDVLNKTDTFYSIGAGDNPDPHESGKHYLQFITMTEGCPYDLGTSAKHPQHSCYMTKRRVGTVCQGDSGSGLYTLSNTSYGIRQFALGVTSFTVVRNEILCTLRRDVPNYYTDFVLMKNHIIDLVKHCLSQ